MNQRDHKVLKKIQIISFALCFIIQHKLCIAKETDKQEANDRFKGKFNNAATRKENAINNKLFTGQHVPKSVLSMLVKEFFGKQFIKNKFTNFKKFESQKFTKHDASSKIDKSNSNTNWNKNVLKSILLSKCQRQNEQTFCEEDRVKIQEKTYHIASLSIDESIENSEVIIEDYENSEKEIEVSVNKDKRLEAALKLKSLSSEHRKLKRQKSRQRTPSISNPFAVLPLSKLQNSKTSVILVSTLSGHVTALDLQSGEVLWSHQFGGKLNPLFSSTLSKMEVTSSGKWVRLIPSLDGSIYQFDGENVEALPINVDTLLHSSYKFNEDTVFSGGRNSDIWGITASTGEIKYSCSSSGCEHTQTERSDGTTIVAKRVSQYVNAIDPFNGKERSLGPLLGIMN